MIIVRIQGGMGNQMFQYAIGRAMSIKHNVPLGLDLTFLLDRTPIPNFTFRDYDLDVFNIEAKIVSREDIPLLYRKYKLGIFMRYIDYLRRKLVSTPGKEKKEYSFDSTVLDLGKNAYLEGWWQTPKYFNSVQDIIRKDFTPKSGLSENIETLGKEIESCNSLSIHVRRGDYVGNTHHEVVGKRYYDEGINKVKNVKNIDKIYVFSDDIAWCAENMKFDFPTMFVGNEYSGKKGEGHMILMSKCHNSIIANSSFSWWAAWLNPNKDKIIVCPKQWLGNASVDTTDLIPENWIRI